jgi:hypothetical protein
MMWCCEELDDDAVLNSASQKGKKPPGFRAGTGRPDVVGAKPCPVNEITMNFQGAGRGGHTLAARDR